MRLTGTDGRSLDLSIIGYQFAGLTGEPGGFDHDANWLVVEGRANDGTRTWKFRDPCLLTVEARELVAWLEAVAERWRELEATDFLEPNLEFRRVSAPTEPPIVRVTFRLESRPPWAADAYEEDDWDRTWLEFATSAEVLRTAASELRAELERFPQRGFMTGGTCD